MDLENWETAKSGKLKRWESWEVGKSEGEAFNAERPIRVPQI
jgi:hypothetical protein